MDNTVNFYRNGRFTAVTAEINITHFVINSRISAYAGTPAFFIGRKGLGTGDWGYCSLSARDINTLSTFGTRLRAKTLYPVPRTLVTHKRSVVSLNLSGGTLQTGAAANGRFFK